MDNARELEASDTTTRAATQAFPPWGRLNRRTTLIALAEAVSHSPERMSPLGFELPALPGRPRPTLARSSYLFLSSRTRPSNLERRGAS